MVKCTIISKKDGGRNISSSHRVTEISLFNVANDYGFITFPHIELKKKHNLMMEFLTCGGRIPRIFTGSKWVKRK
jgi:hypothetical protein